MSIPNNTILEFQKKARETFGALAAEFNLEIIQKDEMTFYLRGKIVEFRLYVYPSHVPVVELSLMPIGSQWNRWQQESLTGKIGFSLAALVSMRKPEALCPDMHFRTCQELSDHVEKLIQMLRDVGGDLLAGDASVLSKLADYIDDRVKRKASAKRLLGILSSQNSNQGCPHVRQVEKQ